MSGSVLTTFDSLSVDYEGVFLLRIFTYVRFGLHYFTRAILLLCQLQCEYVSIRTLPSAPSAARNVPDL